MPLKVLTHSLGKKLFRLEVFVDGKYIGEYERSQEADVARKTEEIRSALRLLQDVYSQYGEFVVRWNGNRRAKIVSVEGSEVTIIPREHWRTPSWEG